MQLSIQKGAYVQSFLSEDRKRLGISQKIAFEKAGVNKATYYRWESGSPIPSDKLALLSELGFDLSFVVTGKRQTINEDKLRDSLEVVFDVLDALRETGEDISNERAAQLVSMIYDLLAKGKSLDENDLQWLTKMAS